MAQGVSLPRVQREFGSLRILCEKYDVELERLKDEDYLDEVLAQLELAGYKLNALNEYKKAIRFFLRDILKCPELASKVRRKEPRDNELTRDDLLTVDEVLKLVSVAMNDRDPALIMCHLDLACRPEEVLTLTVGDFIRDSWGIRVEMRRSKTRRRSPHLSFSLPYISRWLNAHPLKDGPTAPMWIDLNRFRQGVVVPIDNAAYNRILDRLFRRAKIKKNKRFSPYKFRHTGMTMWSVLLTEMQLCKRSGHVPGSKYLKRYTKLVDADTDRKILKELGLISEAEAEPKVKKLSPVKCNLCGEFNEPFRQRCWKCKAALDPARLVTEFREEEIIDVALDDEIWRKIETG